MAALLDRDGGPVVDERLRAGAIGVARDQPGQALGEDETLQRFQIGFHALGIHYEAGGDPLERVQRAAGRVDQLGSGHELGLPAAERALVLPDRAGEQGRQQPGRAGRRGQSLETGDGVALVGHRARAADAFHGSGLEHLADFGLREQRHVARDLADGGRDERELGQEPRELIAVVVPRSRLVQVQAHRETVAHHRALGADRVQGADRAAELDAERPLARLGQAQAAAVERGRPPSNLQPGRDRRGGLHQGTAEHHRAGVAARVADQPARRRRQDAVGVGETRLQAQDQRGVEHVLARRAVVHERRRARVDLGDVLGERSDERHRERARALGLGGERVGRRAQVGADPGDDVRGLRRHDAGVGLGGGQRALEIEHRADERLGGQRLGECVAREAAADDVHERSRARAR